MPALLVVQGSLLILSCLDPDHLFSCSPLTGSLGGCKGCSESGSDHSKTSSNPAFPFRTDLSTYRSISPAQKRPHIRNSPFLAFQSSFAQEYSKTREKNLPSFPVTLVLYSATAVLGMYRTFPEIKQKQF